MTAEQDRLFDSCVHLVIHIAGLMWSPGRPPERADLIQAGNVALIEAAQRFDPGRSVKFSTLAYHCIRNAMLKEIRQACPVHVPCKVPLSKALSIRSIPQEALQHRSDPRQTPEEDYLRKERIVGLRRAVDALPLKQRVVITLRCLGETKATLVEVAKLIRRSRQTAWKTQRIAEARLFNALAPTHWG